MERLIGFTVPRAGRTFVCDHDEVVVIDLDFSSAEPMDVHPYKFVEDNSDFLGLVFDGLAQNEPLLRVGSTSISYSFDPAQEFVEVSCQFKGAIEQLRFRTSSGDWFVASLSDDGQYLVLAEPYEIALYRLT